MFFVISGFVITQSLHKDYLENGRISLTQFYIRRFKRIYPVLIAVIIPTLIFYFLFGNLEQTNRVIKSSLLALVGLSNLYFTNATDEYFLPDVWNPFLHTWSLGVEEQFYFIYPILLIIGLWVVRKFKFNPNIIPVAILAVCLFLYITFCLNKGSLIGGFYFPTARFWELGVGCALFYFSSTSLDIPTRTLCIISTATFFYLQAFHSTIDNLHIETLLTVLATAIAIHTKGDFAKNFLQHKTIVYLGKTSYSLYLWHLPIAYLFGLYLSEIKYLIFTPLATFGCALLSYNLIEKPFRQSNILNNNPIKFFSTLIVIFLGVSALFFTKFHTLSALQIKQEINYSIFMFDNKLKNINFSQFTNKLTYEYTLKPDELCEISKKMGVVIFFKCKPDSNTNVFLLTGDSHAEHLLPTLDNSSTIKNFFYYRTPICIYSSNPCLAFQDLSKNLIEDIKGKYENIFFILSFRYGHADETFEANATKFIQSMNKKVKIILNAPTPAFDKGPKKCNADGSDCTINREKELQRRSEIFRILKRLENQFDNVYVYDSFYQICPDKICTLYDTKKDLLFFRDTDHLTIEGAKFLTPHFDNWLRQSFNLSDSTL